jgi:hypothetical protein
MSQFLSHLRLRVKRYLSHLSAGLGSSLYSHESDPTENTVSVFISQIYFDCCLCIRCCCWPSHCLAMNVFSGSAISGFRRCVTIYSPTFVKFVIVLSSYIFSFTSISYMMWHSTFTIWVNYYVIYFPFYTGTSLLGVFLLVSKHSWLMYFRVCLWRQG